MAEEPTGTFEFDLGDYGGVISAASPDELRKLAQDEWRAWEWVINLGAPPMNGVVAHHNQLREQLLQQAQNWLVYKTNNPAALPNFFLGLEGIFKNYYTGRQIFHSSSVEAEFLSQLREKSKEVVAAGAYAMLLGIQMQGASNDPRFLEGMFEGFLFKHKVDWTGSANGQILNQLRKEYETNISAQNARVQQIEAQNASLNTTKFI